MTKQARLDALQSRIIADNVCAELAASANSLVMGGGNLDADIVFIGEAPGKNEDEQGLPFVGAAGKFLNSMLEAAGFERGDVYITNIVKYRPPNNRDPLPAEKEAFWPILLEQLAVIEPKVIITLGRHSGAYFIPDLVISRDHGQPKRVTYHGCEYLVIPLYHPAAALYNGGLRATLIEDFLRVPELLKTV